MEAEWIEGYISTREFISCDAMATDEETLITDAAGGSSAALQRLFYLYHKRLLSYVTKHMPEELQQQAEPQDVLQDTFFEVTRRITDFKQDGDQPSRSLAHSPSSFRSSPRICRRCRFRSLT